jgi:hypothetical protein
MNGNGRKGGATATFWNRWISVMIISREREYFTQRQQKEKECGNDTPAFRCGVTGRYVYIYVYMIVEVENRAR